jgi:hypothetical protein
VKACRDVNPVVAASQCRLRSQVERLRCSSPDPVTRSAPTAAASCPQAECAGPRGPKPSEHVSVFSAAARVCGPDGIRLPRQTE